MTNGTFKQVGGSVAEICGDLVIGLRWSFHAFVICEKDKNFLETASDLVKSFNVRGYRFNVKAHL